MTTFLHKPYLVNVSVHKRGGGQKYTKICPRGLRIAPYAEGNILEQLSLQSINRMAIGQ